MSKRSRSHSRSFSESESESRSPIPTENTTPPPLERAKIARDSIPVSEVMRCALPPHRETLSFTSHEDYEVHYQQAHVNRCSQCSKNFPTGHFLELHIEENHDPLAAARRERGEKTVSAPHFLWKPWKKRMADTNTLFNNQYGCFIETCERKCSTPQKRRLHLIDKHMFPRVCLKQAIIAHRARGSNICIQSYNFYIINDGIDNQTSLLRPMNSDRNRRRISTASISSINEGRLRRRSSVSQPMPSTNVSQTASQTKTPNSDDMEIDDLSQSMSALRFVPTSVTRNKVKASNPRH